jgi:hypothetical protein
MNKRILGLIALPFMISVTAASECGRGGSQGSCGGGQGLKEARWEGRVERSDKDKSTFTIRKSGGIVERTIRYDSSTKWVSQYHADKKVTDIDPSQIKDGDYVIVKGILGRDGVIHANLVSKRLSHSP